MKIESDEVVAIVVLAIVIYGLGVFVGSTAVTNYETKILHWNIDNGLVAGFGLGKIGQLVAVASDWCAGYTVTLSPAIIFGMVVYIIQKARGKW